MDLYEGLQAKLDNGDFKVGIIGLGYVGLPLVEALYQSGINVLGFDTDSDKIRSLNAGESYLDTVSSDQVIAWRAKELFEATDNSSRLSEADFILICVPTPLNENNEPDLSYVEAT